MIFSKNIPDLWAKLKLAKMAVQIDDIAKVSEINREIAKNAMNIKDSGEDMGIHIGDVNNATPKRSLLGPLIGVALATMGVSVPATLLVSSLIHSPPKKEERKQNEILEIIFPREKGESK